MANEIFSPPDTGPKSTVSRRSVVRRGIETLSLLGLGTQALTASSRPAPGKAPVGASTFTLVKTRSGMLRGRHADGVHTFLGVRYGEDTAARRFRVAEPVRPWAGTRDALTFGDQCLQPSVPDVELMRSGWDQPSASSEDCLSLNIWTPAVGDGKRRPVLFNLHGGGWTTGSGNSSGRSGEKFARHHDVVRINVNHRLGIFGYSYLPELGSDYANSGNVGILDVVMALRWVRDNVSAFGGDPDNVTIFGVSGGGQKVSSLMAMPAAKGLFHRASVESGPMLRAILPAAATKASSELMAALDTPPGNPHQLLSLSGQALLAGYMKMYPDGGLRQAVSGPVVDGVNLPRHPFDPTAPALSGDIPLLIGTTATEMSLFLGFADPAVFTLTWAGLAEQAAKLFRGAESVQVADNIARARRDMPAASPTDILFRFATEATFRGPSIRQAELASRRSAPVYMWLLEWNTPVDGGKWQSPHGLSVPLIMDTVANVPTMFGDGRRAGQAIANTMSACWAAFARTGIPSAPGLPRWPVYEVSERKTMVFDTASAVVSDPHSGLRTMFADRAA